MKNLLIAFQFLTIIPIGRSIKAEETDLPKSASCFVLVGIFQGALLVAADLALGAVFHPDLALAMVLIILIASNGAFHLDALADTFDALAVRGNRERKLAVMKDSAIGPIGVVAIVSALALKYLALKNISHLLPFIYYSSLLLMPVLSKWAMVLALFYGRPVRDNGLGVSFIGRVRFKEVALSTLTMIGFFALTILIAGNYVPHNQYLFYGALMAVVYILCRFMVFLYTSCFGGLTGDIVGSMSEITEIIFLMAVILWSKLYI